MILVMKYKVGDDIWPKVCGFDHDTHETRAQTVAAKIL